MSDITEVKVKTPDYNTAAIGEAIHCEPLFCAFCGKHICPGTQKIYYRFPFSENSKSKTELCSVKCVKDYFATDQWSPKDLQVVQKD